MQVPTTWNVVTAASYDDWLKARDQYLTASDVSAILNCNPYKSRASVLRAKQKALRGEDTTVPANRYMYAGQFQESCAFNWFLHDRTIDATVLGEEAPEGAVMRNTHGTSMLVAHPDPGVKLAASPDAMIVYGDGTRHLVEVKILGPDTTWVRWNEPSKSRAWSKPLNKGGLGQHPARFPCPVPHWIQLQTQLLCTGEEFGWVVGVCGTAKREHPFPVDKAFGELIVQATEKFWNEVYNG